MDESLRYRIEQYLKNQPSMMDNITNITQALLMEGLNVNQDKISGTLHALAELGYLEKIELPPHKYFRLKKTK